MVNALRSSIILAIILLSLRPNLAFGQERLYCGECGKESELKATFCFNCGLRLDKTALVSRLKDRLARVDSVYQHISFTPGELYVLVEELAESKAKEMMRLGSMVRAPRQKTEVEKTLDLVFPIIMGTTAVYLLGQKLY